MLRSMKEAQVRSEWSSGQTPSPSWRKANVPIAHGDHGDNHPIDGIENSLFSFGHIVAKIASYSTQNSLFPALGKYVQKDSGIGPRRIKASLKKGFHGEGRSRGFRLT